MQLNISRIDYDKSGIYQILNILNKKLYIGSAFHFKRRFSAHYGALVRGDHKNKHSQNAIYKYGINNFIFQIIEVIENKDFLIEREQYYLDTIKPQYNIAQFASSPMKGRKQSAKFIHLLSKRNNNKIVTQEMRDKISKTLTGRIGRKLSLEAKQKISKKLMGHSVSEETKLKMKLNKKPWHHSQIAKQKISEASKKRYKIKRIEIIRIIELRNNEQLSFRAIGDMLGYGKTTVKNLYNKYHNKFVDRD